MHVSYLYTGCVTPNAPLNGGVEIVGTSAYYSCSLGSKLVGDRIRNCIGQTWSGRAPECQKRINHI